MWALGLFALTALLFIVGAGVGVVSFLRARKAGRPGIMVAVAMPFFFAAMPMVGLVVLIVLSSAFQKNDLQLYREVFGAGTTAPMEHMLFDDFGRGSSREIYMRIYPDDDERTFLEGLSGLKVSGMTPDQFAARGARHGFMWWISSDPGSPDHCPEARILEADGFNGWREFRIADCDPGRGNVKAPDDAPIHVHGPVYVIAWRRVE